MILTKINPTDEHLLEFSYDIKGTTDKISSIRFIIEGDNFDISIPCNFEDDKINVRIPKLNETVSSGKHNSRLEIIIGDKIFIPINEKLEILENVKVQVDESVKVRKPEIKVEKSNNDNYTIVEEQGHKLLKRDDMYYGLIVENTTFKASKGYSSADDVIKHFSNSI